MRRERHVDDVEAALTRVGRKLLATVRVAVRPAGDADFGCLPLGDSDENAVLREQYVAAVEQAGRLYTPDDRDAGALQRRFDRIDFAAPVHVARPHEERAVREHDRDVGAEHAERREGVGLELDDLHAVRGQAPKEDTMLRVRAFGDRIRLAGQRMLALDRARRRHDQYRAQRRHLVANERRLEWFRCGDHAAPFS